MNLFPIHDPRSTIHVFTAVMFFWTGGFRGYLPAFPVVLHGGVFSPTKNRVKCPTTISGLSLQRFAIKMPWRPLLKSLEEVLKSGLNAILGQFQPNHHCHA